MRSYTRFVPGEEIDAAEPWDFGAVDTASLLLAAQAKVREEASDQVKLDALRQEGFAEGFVQGQAQTRLEAQRQIADYIDNEGQAAAQNFTQLFASVQAQQADSEQVMARGVLELACELARQVLRQELSVNPEALRPVIREALGLLAIENKSALVRLNPADLAVLEEAVRAEFANLSLTLLADATLTRGGCVVEAAGTVVDGTLEKRWMRAVANLGLNSPWEAPVAEQ
jgi:flagellar assembly protein FliH